MNNNKLIYKTRSVCPYCLKTVYADVSAHPDGVYMDKVCRQHGSFSTLIWDDTEENYLRWLSFGGIDVSALPKTEEQCDEYLSGASFRSEAEQLPVSSALMSTNRCNMNCPVCFTRDKKEALYEPDYDECKKLMLEYRARAGSDAIIEFCGGEPTVRDDLPELAGLAKNMGFDFVQLNTNGIRLSQSPEYCRCLKKSGVTTVYLGFDGFSDGAYFAKYARNLLNVKLKAVENCKKVGLAIVLVCCVIPGENDMELGDIVRYAKANMPAVKGIYLQPISYFGIYPPDKIRRITIPTVIRRLCDQCREIKPEHFCPSDYEHPQCSFNATYMLGKDGKLTALSRFSGRTRSGESLSRLRKNLRLTWLPGDRNLLSIGGMAFQDCWNIDLARVRRCSVQIIQKDGRLIPLCSKYLSGINGEKIFPGIG
ncbi:MAG: radical SAM protein [Candidatus Limivicinus sp.]|jgi:uncharacterized radical SAM superfamily Fe-S cluster-containing enzyme